MNRLSARYAPAGIVYRLNSPFGNLAWADEYYTLYPVGTLIFVILPGERR